MKKQVTLILILLVLSLYKENNAQVIIANVNNPISVLSKAAVRNIYLGNTTNWETSNFIKVTDYTSDSKIRIAFSSNFLDLTPQKVSMIWIKVSLSGKAVPPKIFRDEEELKQFISENDNAVGYISSSQNLSKNLKIVQVK